MRRGEAAEPARDTIRGGCITILYERKALNREDVRAFAELAERGLGAMERLAGCKNRGGLCFELGSSGAISSTHGRTIYLPAGRIAARTAPYLHEIVHVLLPCRRAPAWFSEGVACYFECLVSERGEGYDSHLFTANGNAGVDTEAARWLTDARGHAVLPYVGTRGTPRRILEDRQGVAAPFYVLSHSLVKYLAEGTSVPAVAQIARSREFAKAVRSQSGKKMAEWREQWLATVRAERDTRTG